MILLVLAGCTDTSVRPGDSSELKGLKLQDLKPTGSALEFPKIIFDVVLFKAPSGKADSIKTAFEPLKSNPIHYADSSAFEQNGLFAVRGQAEQGVLLTEVLASIGAKRLSRTSIILFEQKPELLPAEFVPAELLTAERYISYTDTGGAERTIITPPGQLLWQLWAWSDSFVHNIVNVGLMPVFVPLAGAEIRNVTGLADAPRQTFPSQQISLSMRKGDFVLLAPCRLTERSTLDRMLFCPTAERKSVLLYVIVCAKTEN